MANIKIVTDSVSDLPQELLDKWNIDVIPCSVTYGGETYNDDGEELDRTDFYQTIERTKEVPTTAAPPIALAQEMLENALSGHDHVVSIHVAESLSSTYNNVLNASKSDGLNGKVTVLDSETLSMGIGWQVLVAAEVAEQTGDLDTVVRAVNAAKKNQMLYAAIYTMDFLRRSGRVNNVVASIGSLLQIKPILQVFENGDVQSTHRVRTFKKAKAKLTDLLKEEGELDRLAIIHTQNEAVAQEFLDEHRALMPEDVIITEVGPTLGTHIGLKSLGFVSLKKAWRDY